MENLFREHQFSQVIHLAAQAGVRYSIKNPAAYIQSNVVGFELVELLPYRATGYETALNSERIVRECLVGIAMRKKGIDEPHYLSPMTTDDGRD